MNSTMKKFVAKAVAMMAATTMFAAGVPALAAHAADKNGAVFSSTAVRNAGNVSSYERIGDLDTSRESYQQPVTIVNNSGRRIDKVCIAASEDTCWGDDICGKYYLDNGDSLDTSFCVHDNYTTYDIYWVYEDGTKESCSDFDLSDYPTGGFTVTIKEESVATSYSMNF